MARLIDAKALEKQIKEAFEDTNPVLMGQMLRWVRKQTTIDAVPVVRCKDCAFGRFDEDGYYACLNNDGINDVVHSDDYCSYGERRTDEGKAD